MAQLKLENEQLRAIFETANEEFARLRRRVSSLEEELKHEKERNTIMEEENRSLKLELGETKGVVKKLSSMLFGLKSEKLKIADIDIKDTVAFEGKETAISPNEVTSKVSFLEEKEKRPKGAVSGHPGHGRKIHDEISFGKQDASFDDIEKSAKLAHCHEFILKMKKNYETIVGERGTKLSVGQKQRIALARALIIDPQILILDEATSNLDSESEGFI